MTNIPLAKKTKSEVLEAYNQLLTQFEEAKKLARSVEEPKSKEAVEEAKNHTAENIIKEMGELKLSIHGYIDSVADKLLNASRLFNQFQEAIVISQNQLQSVQNIQTAADALDHLIKEYELKKRELESQYQCEQDDLQLSISAKKRDWQREIEEYSYTTQLKRKREKEQFEEELMKRSKLLDEKEADLKNKEEEFNKMKNEIASFSLRLETEINKIREQVTKDLESEFANETTTLIREKENEQNIAKIRISHLEDITKKQSLEIEKSKVEIEKAYAQSQNLALKLVESSSYAKTNKVTDSGEQNS